MIPTTIRQLLLSNAGFIILLDSTDDERSLPIFIGAAEAQAIAFQLNKVELPRPLTHDLILNLLDATNYDVVRIEIHDIQQGTFFANIILQSDDEEISIDSRPSDAIAVAIRCNIPIFVSEKVMNDAGRIFQEEGEDTVTEIKNNNKPEKKIQHVPPLTKLKRSLKKAIAEERYEDAATLRDEIDNLKNSHTGN